MVVLPFSRRVLLSLSTIATLSLPLAAQEKKPTSAASDTCPAAPASPSLNVDAIAKELDKQDEALNKAAEEVRKVVNDELAAKRINPVTAQSLLDTLRGSNSALHFLGGGVAYPGRSLSPTPNEAVAKAEQKLETVANQLQADQRKLLSEAVPQAYKETMNALRTAQKPGEVDALLAPLGRLQELVASRGSAGNSTAGRNDLQGAITLLHNLQTVLVTREGGDPKLLGMALAKFQNISNYDALGWSNIDAQKRIDEFFKPYSDAVETAQKALDDALLGGRPSTEITPRVAAFETAQRDLTAVRSSSISYNTTSGFNPLETYRTLAGLARQMEEHGTEAVSHNGLSNPNVNLSSLGGDRVALYSALLEKWQKQAADAADRERAEQRAALKARLNAVKTPQDLEAVAADIDHVKRPFRSIEPAPLGNLGPQLHSLAAAWLSGNPASLTTPSEVYSGVSDSYAAEIAALQERIHRDLLSKVIPAPELLKPPLADQPLTAALSTLSHQLSDAHEWRRLLVLLESHPRARAVYASSNLSPTGDAIIAIRSYLTGQNYELAEQWTDAIFAYKAVLATTADVGPIKEAAERLKTLTKEHPADVPSAPFQPRQ